MVWQVHGGPKGHGAELMNNIAIASMHAILYIDILGPTFVISGGPMAPLVPPVPPPMYTLIINLKITSITSTCVATSQDTPASSGDNLHFSL